tara:strand:+ start:960 stop:1142 length:183 start_codon:yes stop_codon:yes gene_type:complete
MAVKYNIVDLEGNITHEGISIDEVNEIIEGADINAFWDDEGLAERLDEGCFIIKTIEIEE